MHRGWVKQWRKELFSDIWEKPPLYFKLWQWLKLTVDKNTGEISRSLREIATELQWYERGQLKTPNPKTISDILEWLEGKKMVTIKIQGVGNIAKRTISVCKWPLYQAVNGEQSNSQVTMKVTNSNNRNKQEGTRSTRSTAFSKNDSKKTNDSEKTFQDALDEIGDKPW